MPKHYRLTTRAQLHGEVRDSGYIFTLAEGELGPMRTVSGARPDIQLADHIGVEGGLRDEPMYAPLTDAEERAIEEAEAAVIRAADEHAAASRDERAGVVDAANEPSKPEGAASPSGESPHPNPLPQAGEGDQASAHE